MISDSSLYDISARAAQRTAWFIFFALVLPIALVVVYFAGADSRPIAPVVTGVLVLASVVLGMLGHRTRVVADSQSVEVRALFRTKTVAREAVRAVLLCRAGEGEIELLVIDLAGRVPRDQVPLPVLADGRRVADALGVPDIKGRNELEARLREANPELAAFVERLRASPKARRSSA